MKRTLTRILGAGLGLALPFLSGCAYERPPIDQPSDYLEGEVLKEGGTVTSIVESSGAAFGNESVKFGGKTYTLKVNTTKGEYNILVGERYKENYKYSTERKRCFKSLEALQSAIEPKTENSPGTTIIFPTKIDSLSVFTSDGIGRVPSDFIKIKRQD